MMKKQLAIVCVAVALMTTGCIGPNYMKTGLKALEEKKYEDALEAFSQETKEKKPDLAEAYRGMGIASFELGKYKEAVEALEKALHNGAEETVTLYNLMAVSQMKMEQYADAIEALETGMTLEGGSEELNREMLYNLLVCYEKNAEWEKAKKTLDVYLETYPSNAKILKEKEFLETR